MELTPQTLHAVESREARAFMKQLGPDRDNAWEAGFGHAASEAIAVRQMKHRNGVPVDVEGLVSKLPGQDSNLEKQDQNLL